MCDKIVCIGEILWDSLPLGLFLGGAPYNVAYHLNKLGNEVVLISRVGDDDLGLEAIKRVDYNGISTEFIQIDNQLHTGFVEVDMDENGVPKYNIKMPAAWDEIQLLNSTKLAILSANAIVFGTLAQRSEISKKTIQSIESTKCLKVLDLNLRYPFVYKKIIEKSLEIADVVKMNSEEFEALRLWFNLLGDMNECVQQLAIRFSLRMVCVTRGKEGAILWNKKDKFESNSYKVKVIDTVGSGDSFLAVMVFGYLQNYPLDSLLDYANRLGAFMATQTGGTPIYTMHSLDDIASLPLH